MEITIYRKLDGSNRILEFESETRLEVTNLDNFITFLNFVYTFRKILKTIH